MSKKIQNSNPRVEISPTMPWNSGRDSEDKQFEDGMRSCKQIEEEVKRHVDQEGVEIVYDTGPICEFCDAYWTEDNDEYNGGCCAKDIENEPGEQP